jgi:hypothetical protein
LLKFHNEGAGAYNIKQRIKYDYRLCQHNLPVKYFVTAYQNQSSFVKHWEKNSERHQKKIVFQSDYVYDGKDFKVIN